MKIINLVLLILFAAVISAQTPQVVINEFAAKANPEWIEIYNTTSSPIDLSGWCLINTPNDTTFLSGTLAGNAYTLVTLSSAQLNNDGDLISLVNSSGDTVDYAGYGTRGPAPVGIYNSNNPAYSTARITDGCYTSPNNGRDFNIDGTPTPGTANDAHPAPLTAQISINELDPYGGTTVYDSVELFNSTSSDIDVGGWFISDGDDFRVITGTQIVPANGFLVIDSSDFSGVNFTSADVCYLFMADSQRVDQLGWNGDSSEYTYQRVPDGGGPHDGYNWVSSGGGTTLFDKIETWGETNGTVHVVEETPDAVFPEGYSLACPSLSGRGGIEVAFMAPGNFTLGIYSLDGRLVKEMFTGKSENRSYLTWDLSDSEGRPVSQGHYILMLSDEAQRLSLKLEVIY